jgi:hypothetical protein
LGDGGGYGGGDGGIGGWILFHYNTILRFFFFFLLGFGLGFGVAYTRQWREFFLLVCGCFSFFFFAPFYGRWCDTSLFYTGFTVGDGICDVEA